MDSGAFTAVLNVLEVVFCKQPESRSVVGLVGLISLVGPRRLRGGLIHTLAANAVCCDAWRVRQVRRLDASRLPKR